MVDYKAFDDGFFSEDELRILKRMLPVAYVSVARKLSRRDFFSHVNAGLKKPTGSLRQTLLGLSKRT